MSTEPKAAQWPSSPCYFTDGVNLYRFIAWLDRAGSASLAAVEDCRSLDVLVVNAKQLRAAAVRQVPSHPPDRRLDGSGGRRAA